MHRHRQSEDIPDADALSATDDVTEQIADLLAGYALNALSAEETAFVEEHLPDRPAWQWELASYQRISGSLAYAHEPQAVPVRSRAAILARIDALAIESQAEAIARANPSGTLRRRLQRARTHVPRVAWAAAVPATLVAVVLIMTSIVMQERISDQQDELAAYQQEQVKVNDLLLADDAGQQVVDLVPSSVAPLARGRLLIDLQDQSAMLVVRDMPQPGEGDTYVVWMLIGTNHDEYAQLGEISVDDLGRGQKLIDPPNDFSVYPVVRITIEQDSDAGFPSGPEVMTGGIPEPDSN